MAGDVTRTPRNNRGLLAGVSLGALTIAVALFAPGIAGAGGTGHLDRSFGHDGRLVVNRAQDYANAVAVGRKGRIVVAGYKTIARRRPNGRADHSFADRGIARLDSGPYANEASSVALDSSSVAIGKMGAIYTAGSTCSTFTDCEFAVTRLRRDGTVSRWFGQDGTVRIGFPMPDSEALAVARVRGGRLVVGGFTCESTCDFALARLNRDDSLDRSFGEGGKALVSLGGCYPGHRGMALDSRGRIVIGNSCESSSVSLARLKPNGQLDRSFGRRGRVTRHVPIQRMEALTIDSRNRIDVTGRSEGRFGVIRFGSKGRFDSSFGHHGIARAKFPEEDYAVPHAMAIDSRGRIVVAGEAGGFGFARFKPQGRLDHHFGHRGVVHAGRRERLLYATSVAIDRGGRIVATGDQREHGVHHFALVRLLG